LAKSQAGIKRREYHINQNKKKKTKTKETETMLRCFSYVETNYCLNLNQILSFFQLIKKNQISNYKILSYLTL